MTYYNKLAMRSYLLISSILIILTNLVTWYDKVVIFLIDRHETTYYCRDFDFLMLHIS